MISVIIPSYNRAKTIKRAAQSVLNQTYKDIELIIVDDCSSDNTPEIIANIMVSDKRVRCIRHEKNMGACVARNTGIDAAQGEYIAFQDSDDEWLPEKLEIQLDAMQQNNADISFCQFKRVWGERVETVPQIDEGFIERDTLLEKSIVSTQVIVAKKECFETIRFNPKMPRLQDYDIAIRLSERYPFYFVKKQLANMYVQDDSISTNWAKLNTAQKLLFEQYGDYISSNKNMDYYQTRYLVWAKTHVGENAIKESFHCFKLRPSTESLKEIIKSVAVAVGIKKYT